MIFLVDGDNEPGRLTKGADKLNVDDVITIFYADNNNYYKKQEKRKELVDSTMASVIYKEVVRGSCSVDFSVAIFLTRFLSNINGNEIYALISKDKHFELLPSKFKEFQGSNLVVSESYIEDAYFKYKFLEFKDSNSIKYGLSKIYGSELTERLIDRIRSN